MITHFLFTLNLAENLQNAHDFEVKVTDINIYV